MYTVAVHIEGLDKRRRSTGIVHVIMGFFLLLKCPDLFRLLGEELTVSVLLLAAVAIVSLVYGLLRKRFDPLARHNAGLRLLQAIAFVSFGLLFLRFNRTVDAATQFVWGFLALILFFSEKKLFRDTALSFTDAGIKIPGVYTEQLVKWEVLEDVTVRHDFITLFHRGKKYLQYQVSQDLSELEVVKMNAFCRDRIQASETTENQP